MSSSFDRLITIMAKLRNPDGGCPWDVEQTFATIAPHTIEEAYEVADAIEHGDMDELRDELGDLLLQVIFPSRMAEEENLFDAEDVINAITDKMIRRHPHVFGDEFIATADAKTVAWEDQKAQERADKAARNTRHDSAPHSVLDGVSVGLPALTRSLKLQKRAARVGFDWANPRRVLDKFHEEIKELEVELDALDRDPDHDPDRLKDEVGDLLFTCVNIARQLDIDPETALRHGNAKFERRFRKLETMVADAGCKPGDMSLDALELTWAEVKKHLE